jgi:hypothetical protein
MGRAGTQMLVELTEFDRPHRLGSRTASSMMQTSGALTFAADGDGTVMSWDWQVRPKGWMRMLGPLFGPLGGRMERRIWTSMKQYLENAAARPVTRPRALARSRRASPDVLGEKGQHSLPGVGRRGGVVGAPLVVEEGVLGARVDLQVVRMPAAVSSVSSTPAALVVKSLPGRGAAGLPSFGQLAFRSAASTCSRTIRASSSRETSNSSPVVSCLSRSRTHPRISTLGSCPRASASRRNAARASAGIRTL